MCVYTHRKNPVKTQREDAHLQVKEKGTTRNQPCWHLDLRLLVSKIVRKNKQQPKPQARKVPKPNNLTPHRSFLEGSDIPLAICLWYS